MRKIAVFAFAIALFLSGCAPLANAPAETPQSAEAAPSELGVTASPVLSPRGDVYVLPGVAYAASPDALPPPDLLTNYRPFPGELNAEELKQALAALPAIHLETPQTGGEKEYLKDNPMIPAGCLAEGTITEKSLFALVEALKHPARGEMLSDTLETYGLSFERMSGSSFGDVYLYYEKDAEPYRVKLREMEAGVILITLYPPEQSVWSMICHMVFCPENGVYRFAAIDMPWVESCEFHDRVVSANGLQYFVCGCGAFRDDRPGMEIYRSILTICPMQKGVYGRLWYQAEGYSRWWLFRENLALRLSGIERADNGGAHFTFEGKFSYEDRSDLNDEGFEDIFCGTLTLHVYDDGDGKGLYIYPGEIGPKFGLSLYDSQRLRELFSQRAALLLRAEDDDICLAAENFVWQWALSPEGYFYLNSGERYGSLKTLRETPYAGRPGEGEKYYVGNDAPQPAGSGFLSGEALAALETVLSSFDTDAAEAIAAAGLTLPEGVSLPAPHRAADTPDHAFKRLARYEMDDALALELRAPDGEMFDSLMLLFLRTEEGYTFLTALPRRGYMLDEAELDYDEGARESKAFIFEINGLKYLYFSTRPREDGEGDRFDGGVLVPFMEGGVTSRLRMAGGCMLPGVSGTPLGYELDIWDGMLDGRRSEALDIDVSYDISKEMDLRFEMPLTLYNDGDGKGFYSLDANSEYFFGDILSVPYAREQLEGQLKICAESSKRAERAVADVLLKMVFGEQIGGKL